MGSLFLICKAESWKVMHGNVNNGSQVDSFTQLFSLHTFTTDFALEVKTYDSAAWTRLHRLGPSSYLVLCESSS